MSLRGKSSGRAPVGSFREIDVIVAEVGARTGFTPESLRGRDLRKPVRLARHEAIARAYATGRFSSLRLGQYFNGRDHSTILNAVSAAERLELL